MQGHGLAEFFKDICIVVLSREEFLSCSPGKGGNRNTGMRIGGPADSGELIDNMGEGDGEWFVRAVEAVDVFLCHVFNLIAEAAKKCPLQQFLIRIV